MSMRQPGIKRGRRGGPTSDGLAREQRPNLADAKAPQDKKAGAHRGLLTSFAEFLSVLGWAGAITPDQRPYVLDLK